MRAVLALLLLVAIGAVCCLAVVRAEDGPTVVVDGSDALPVPGPVPAVDPELQKLHKSTTENEKTPTSSNVVELSAESLRLKLLSRHARAWVINFYSARDVDGKKLEQKYRKASLRAEPLSSAVRFGSVNCDVHGDLCDKYRIEATPTILGVSPKKDPVEYKGSHMIRDIMQFAAEQIPQFYRSLRTSEDADEFFKGRAPKIVYFTDEDKGAPAEFRVVAFDHHKKLDFAIVRSKRTELMERFLKGQVTNLPAYVVFTGKVVNGEATFSAKHKGDGLLVRPWIDAILEELDAYLKENGGKYPPLDEL